MRAKEEVLRNYAKELRKNATEAENKLWYLLRNRQFKCFKFRRQYIIAPFIVDFICLSKRLIIELDGSQHVEMEKYDQMRTRYLKAKGYKIIRFWNDLIFKEIEGVANSILNELDQRT